jgi:hypothetical protein
LEELLTGTSTPTPTPTPDPDPEPTPQPELTNELPSESDIIKFTGSADVIEVAPGGLPDYAAAAVNFTFTADNPDRLQGLVSNDAEHYGNHFSIYLDNGMMNVRFQTSSGQEIILTKSGIVAGQTYDVSVTTNGSEVGLIVDGSLEHSAQLTWYWTDSDQYLQIGANGWASSDGAAGYSDVFVGTIQGFSFEPITAVQPPSEPEPNAPTDTPTLTGRLSAILDKFYDSLSGNSSSQADAAMTESVTVPADEEDANTPEVAAAPDEQVDTQRVAQSVEEPEPAPLVEEAVYNLFGSHEINGAVDVIQIKHSQEMSLPEATVALTFNANTVDGYQGLLSKDAYGYSGGGNHFTSYIKDGTLIVRFQDGGASKELSIAGIQVNVDYDFQFSFGNNEVTAMLNGDVFGRAAFDTSWETNEEFLQMGANGWASDSGEAGFTHVFDGTISDVIIYNEANVPLEQESYGDFGII